MNGGVAGGKDGVLSLSLQDCGRVGGSEDLVTFAPLSSGDDAPLLLGLLLELGGLDGDPLCLGGEGGGDASLRLQGDTAGGDPLGLPGGGEPED